MDVEHFPVSIDKNKLTEEILKIIKKLKPDWNVEDIQFKIFTDGITNKLIGCYCNDEPNNMILVKVYGEKTNLFINRTAEMTNFKLLNSRGYAPKLFATFDNGMVYEYIPGEELTTHSCREKTVYPMVACMLAKMHKLRHHDNVSLVPVLWDKCKCFIDLISDTFSSSDLQRRYEEHFPGGQKIFQSELKELQNWLKHVDSPVVFCHNDLLMKNVIFARDCVWFIDYEYAGYNYQAYDIANHFAEFAGVAEFDISLYPSAEFMMEWIREYLKEYNGTGNIVDDTNVKKVHENVIKFTPVAHFFWAMWSLVQLQNSSIDFDYFTYTVNRYNEYKKSLKLLKQRYVFS